MMHSVLKYFIFLVVAQLQLSCVVHAQNQSPTSIIGNELLFKDCEKAIESVNRSDVPITPAEKDTISKYLERIIGLEPFSNQFVEQKGIPRNLGLQSNNIDMSHLFDPEREKKAKICAIKMIPKLYPQSATTVIKLLDITRDKKNSFDLRDSSFELTKEITGLIQRVEFPEYLVLEILNSLIKNENVLRSRISIPLLVAIAGRIEIPWSTILETSDPALRANVLDAFIIENLNRESSYLKISSLLEIVDDGAKAQAIMRLQSFAQSRPNIIELLPGYFSSSSELVRFESLKLLKFLAMHPSLYAYYYTSNQFPEKSLSQYLKLLKESNEAIQREIIKALLHVELKSDHPACRTSQGSTLNSTANDEISNDTLSLTLLKSICLITPEDKVGLTNLLTEGSINDAEIASTILIHQNKIDDSSLKLLVNKLSNMKKNYSSREYALILQLILRGSLNVAPTKVNQAILNLAAEGLGMNLELPPIMRLFSFSKENPAVELLSKNFKNSEQLLIKSLKEKSSLIKGNALSALNKLDSKKTKFSTNLTSVLVKLLEDEELEVRRLSYLALKTQDNLDLSKNLTLKTITPPGVFYQSRLMLELSTSKIGNNINTFENFVVALSKVDCRERTIALPAGLLTKLSSLPITTQDLLENTEEECLRNPSYNIKLRALNNLSAISPLKDKSLTKIVELSESLFVNSNDKLIYQNLFDLVLQNINQRPETREKLRPVIANGLNNKQREDVLIATINWLMKNSSAINQFSKELLEIRDNSNQTVSVLVNLILLAIENTPDNFEKLRSEFSKNLELSKEIISSDVSKLTLNIPEASQNFEESSPYFQIFINTLRCNSKRQSINNENPCSHVLPIPSTVIDKPDLVGASLYSLISYSLPSENREIIKELLNIMVSMGHTEEITSSLKLPLTGELLKEMRVNSTNLAYSKVLDFLIEHPANIR